jgi:hypothetical protein
MLREYIGQCFVCFGMVEKGRGYQIRKGGRLFHEECVHNTPLGYYVLLEKKHAEEEAEHNQGV